MLRTKNADGTWKTTDRFHDGLRIIGKDIRNIFDRLLAEGYTLEEAQVLIMEEFFDSMLNVALGFKG